MRWHVSMRYVLCGVIGISGGCAAVPPCPLPEAAPSVASTVPQTSSQEAVLVSPPAPPSDPALERKVKLQEKRIAELSFQLRLLKRIDLDRGKP